MPASWRWATKAPPGCGALGIRLPIYPVKGYSLTFPVGDWAGAPVVPMSDDGHHVAVVRIGDRVRVAGTAELTGYDRTLTPGTHPSTCGPSSTPSFPTTPARRWARGGQGCAP